MGAASRFGAGTMLSRLLGLVREQAFAALVGAGGLADAFVVLSRGSVVERGTCDSTSHAALSRHIAV